MAHLTQDYVDHLYNTFGDLKVLDDIIRHRAADKPPAPILGYPRYDDSVDDFEQFTGQQLDRFVDAACKHYLASGLKAVSESQGSKLLRLFTYCVGRTQMRQSVSWRHRMLTSSSLSLP